MAERVYANDIIKDLRNVDDGDGPVGRAIGWLVANLTDAARAGCHHCGEAERSDAPCWWCGLRDEPRKHVGDSGRTPKVARKKKR